MGQVLHGSATTTEAIRRAIQHSQESLRALAKRYGIDQKTVAKWKKRTSVTDLPTGPREPRSAVLSIEEEAVIVAFRRYTLLPLDDCLYALQPTIPHLTRSSLHRCQGSTCQGRALPRPRFRAGIRQKRYRASHDQCEASLDQWPGGKNEPHHQGRHRQALLLRKPRPPPPASRRLRRRPQFRSTSEDPQGAHALRVHL